MFRAIVMPPFLLILCLVIGCGPKDKGVPAAPDAKSKEKPVQPTLTPDEEAKLKQAVAEGDALFDAGLKSVNDSKKPPYKVPDRKKFDEAYEKYMVVVNAPQPLSDKPVMARVYGRVIDVATGRKNNKALAKEVAVKALRQEILPVCNSPESAPILAAARKELKAEDKELDDWLEKEEKKRGGTKANKGSAAAEDLKKLGYAEIVRRLGEPDEDYRSKKKPNMGLAIWETGDNEYTVVSFIEAIDGISPTLVLTVHDKRSRSIVENMKRSLDNPKK